MINLKGKQPLTLEVTDKLQSLSMKLWQRVHILIFWVRSLLGSSSKLSNLWQYIHTCIQMRLKHSKTYQSHDVLMLITTMRDRCKIYISVFLSACQVNSSHTDPKLPCMITSTVSSERVDNI